MTEGLRCPCLWIKIEWNPTLQLLFMLFWSPEKKLTNQLLISFLWRLSTVKSSTKMSCRVNFHPPVLVDTCDEECMWTHLSLSELRWSGRVFKTAYDLYKYLFDFMTSKLSISALEIHQRSCRMCMTVELLNYVVGKLIVDRLLLCS